MNNWNEVDFDSVLGDEISLDSVLERLNSEYGANFKLGSVVADIEKELISEKANDAFSFASSDGDWIPYTLTEKELEAISGGEDNSGTMTVASSVAFVQTAVVANTSVVVNVVTAVGAVVAIVAAVAIVVLVLDAPQDQ